MSHRFRPKVDVWLSALILLLTLGTIIPVFRDPNASWGIRALALAIDIFLWWMLLGSSYVIDEARLIGALGPIRFSFPLESIVKVRKGGWWAMVSSFREPRLRLAFSTDNLIVESRNKGKTRRMVISPRDREGFLRLLQEKAPQVALES